MSVTVLTLLFLWLQCGQAHRVPLVLTPGSHLAGFPPIPGQKGADAEQGFVAALMAADKLISNDNVEAADDDDDEEEVGGPASVFNWS